MPWWTCEPALSAGEKGKGKMGKPLHFKGSTFHRVVRTLTLLSLHANHSAHAPLRSKCRADQRLHVPGRHTMHGAQAKCHAVVLFSTHPRG